LDLSTLVAIIGLQSIKNKRLYIDAYTSYTYRYMLRAIQASQETRPCSLNIR